MKINYDNEINAVYIEFSKEVPEGVVEIKEGVNLDVTKNGRIVGLEILDASQKVSLDSFLNYELSPEWFNQTA
ncbi:hypothetical protein BMS3Abin04_02916 [bacterium BMS3Abin04]|nr:hypothetical protein BMS3Abin04_02916 [bacterium BMS3Abin04]